MTGEKKEFKVWAWLQARCCHIGFGLCTQKTLKVTRWGRKCSVSTGHKGVTRQQGTGEVLEMDFGAGLEVIPKGATALGGR